MQFCGNQPYRFKFRIRRIASLTVLAAAGFGSASAADIWKSPDNYPDGTRILVTCNTAQLPSEIDIEKFEARDLVVLKDAYSISVKGKTYSELKREKDSALERSQYFPYCGEEDEFILIGKDTGVKKRWQDTLPMDDLFQTIDAMPMRQFEMKTRGAN